MNCDEIQRALDGDTADFKVAVRHIKKCPYCSRIYKDELELEYSLRELSFSDEEVDILPDLYEKLEFEKPKPKASAIIKRWAWVASAFLSAVLVYLNLDAVVALVNSGLGYVTGFSFNVSETETNTLNQMAETFKTSDYFSLVVLLVGCTLAVVFYYLWREFKEIAR